MKTKFKKALSETIKDMGLTEKAIDDLVMIGCEGLKDDATDEDIKKAVDLLVPVAKVIQGEITRKTRNRDHQPSTNKPVGAGEGEEGDEKGIAAIIAKQLEPFKEQLESLQKENETLKAEKVKGERNALIAEKAKKLGIPEYLMKRITIADDADVDKELGDFKNDLVSNNLLPKDAVQEPGKIADQMKADAEAWAKNLPNK